MVKEKNKLNKDQLENKHELKSVSTDNTLIVIFLDPRFKHFNWTTNGEQDKAYQL
ncbi:8809_t:CDS:2, partial [Funneliformis geosporum]